jgi:glucan exporter ATP-binding protein
VPVIQSFTRIELEARALRGVADRLLAAQIPVLGWWAVAAVATRASATITILGIFLLGTYLNLNGQATVGQIVAFMSLATMLIARMEQAVGFMNGVLLQAPKLREFFDIMDTVPAVRDIPGAPDLGRATGTIQFDNVSFSYDGKRAAVADVSFSVKPGETVALVGATGSGKSTSLGLLHRAFDPQSGQILVDGKDIREVSLASLRRNIGVVFQEPMLFAREIEENLRVGRPDASDEDIRRALERAQAAEFIDRMPDGLDTVVGERGRSLSGGERQRLSIARAILKDPPILILDEATSALDAGTEAKLQQALQEVMVGRTTLVIAHRLATIRNADRILVLRPSTRRLRRLLRMRTFARGPVAPHPEQPAKQACRRTQDPCAPHPPRRALRPALVGRAAGCAGHDADDVRHDGVELEVLRRVDRRDPRLL